MKGATLRLGSARRCRRCASEAVTGDVISHVVAIACEDRKSTRLNSSHTEIYTLSLHDALPIYEGCNPAIGKRTPVPTMRVGSRHRRRDQPRRGDRV